ncbi:MULTISPECIES: heme biosynthesis HemY N-terminal domain-containing protein [Pseudoalteromonas]|jgi:HemY protein|uniref:HemY protein n=1 Tax=Pseudoalteromonas lipolytica TaxID=570156 RepID=A0AAD0RW73_9GAMM|nr:MULTISPECIES: heme biosynthesis HemY N-terminal domain-containing protein [Pseudoalteromonas]MAE01917.1 heme biosynthesis protein [Pseudoalteromonas sp.]AXV63918.1 heme biosynthesis protein HemY [Pseudoalteromonas donghaensis]MBE0352415.1 HemY protein [Pseudoalteromonas lipolytica LMEB 39]MCC9662216.1 heme biosynthesis protein HemY [Pseudoalteromonas sp. MB41]QLJ08409.1 heme biosynthesis protein HemY [Pseudoalteromonas sp. JSTW]|tara:strand:+ start:4734 stop:5843 length:1110 start_codon:yes stop_codon:yes gene_type:complete
MIRFLLLIIAIAVCLGIAPFFIDQKGYVLIAFNKTTIEGTIWGVAALIVLGCGIAYLGYKLVRYLWSLYSHTRHRFFARSEERKQAAIEQGVWSLINNDYAELELALDNNSVAEPWTDIRYALLAKAALANNNSEKAISYLDKINQANQLKVANLWLASGECSTIFAELKTLAERKKATNLELKMYAQVLVQEQKWSALDDFMPRLLRKKVLTEKEWQQVFDRYFAAQADTSLTERFEQLTKNLKPMAEVSYLKAMARAGKLNKIELSLIKMIKKPLQHKDLARILRTSAAGDALKLQASLQDVLKKDTENTDLLLALACLANAHGEYDLAARVFDKALNATNRDDYLQQAVLSYSKSGQPDKALVLYQ